CALILRKSNCARCSTMRRNETRQPGSSTYLPRYSCSIMPLSCAHGLLQNLGTTSTALYFLAVDPAITRWRFTVLLLLLPWLITWFYNLVIDTHTHALDRVMAALDSLSRTY